MKKQERTDLASWDIFTSLRMSKIHTMVVTILGKEIQEPLQISLKTPRTEHYL